MSGAAGWLGGAVVLGCSLAAWEAGAPLDQSAPVRMVAMPMPSPSEQQSLQARLASLARGFDGRVGLFVRPLDGSWSVSIRGDQFMPQQSVSKLWVAMALLAAVDRGDLSLDETVVIRREDLSIFHQPIRALVGDAGYRTTLRRLLAGALQQSDNAANDALVRRLGGPFAVRVSLVGRNLEGVRFGPGERALQTAAAGLRWKPQYSFDRTFWQERDALSADHRRTALAAYLANPPDGATARGIADALARLKSGQLLSAESTALMLDLMENSETGQARLRGGLAPGWRLAHKTGTGQVMGSLATGFNDVGVFTAPDGRVYVAAVLIAQTRRPLKERQAFMTAVARAICETAADPGKTERPGQS